MEERDNHASPGRASGSPGGNYDTNTAGWDSECRRYWCRDGVAIGIPRVTAIACTKSKKSKAWIKTLLISRVKFGKKIERIIHYEGAVRTITFPKTVRTVK